MRRKAPGSCRRLANEIHGRPRDDPMPSAIEQVDQHRPECGNRTGNQERLREKSGIHASADRGHIIRANVSVVV